MKFIKTVFLLLILLQACNLLAQSPGNAVKLYEMKQYSRAKSAFLADLKTRNSASDWFKLGKIYSLQNQSDSARLCFSKIAETEPRSALNIIAQAISELSSGNNTQALTILDKAQKTAASAKDVNALIEIAPIRYQAGDTAGWINPLMLASVFDSKNVKAYITAGEIYCLLGDRFPHQPFIGLASGRFEQALYLDPGNIQAYTAQAELFILGRNYTEAGQYLSNVILKDSNYIPALKIYGELSYTLGRYDKASVLYGRYMALAEHSEKDLSRYINILYFNNEYAKAIELISPVLAKEPSNAVMLRLKGYISYELGKYPEGLDAMRKFFELRSAADTSKILPSDYEYMGKLFSRNGNDSVSIIFLKKAVEMDSTRNGLLEDISKSYEKQKKYLQAVEFYSKFVTARNGNVAPAIYFSIGKDLLIQANDVTTTADSLLRPVYLKRADTAFRKVIELSPGSHLGYLWHARVMAALDPETTLGLARADYEQALALLEPKADKVKYKNDLVEGYRYMGYYTYLQFETAKAAHDESSKERAKTNSLNFWQKVLELDPENDKAKQAINALK